MLKHGILGLLNYQDMTGYEIDTVFRDSLYYFWNAQTSQIYRELQTLEQKGWVSKCCVPQQGRPDKNVYSVTEEGREELLRWLSEDGPGIAPRVPVLMKVFFMGERGREENIRYFEALKSCCEMFVQSLAAVPGHIANYSNYLGDREKALYWQMTVEYGLQNMKMHIEWAQSCIDRLRAGLKGGMSQDEDSGNQRKSKGGQEQYLEADEEPSGGDARGAGWEM